MFPLMNHSSGLFSQTYGEIRFCSSNPRQAFFLWETIFETMSAKGTKFEGICIPVASGSIHNQEKLQAPVWSWYSCWSCCCLHHSPATRSYPSCSQATHCYPSCSQATHCYPRCSQATDCYPRCSQATACYPRCSQATACYPRCSQATACYPRCSQATACYPRCSQATACYPAAPKQLVVIPAAPKQLVVIPAAAPKQGLLPRCSLPSNTWLPLLLPSPSSALLPHPHNALFTQLLHVLLLVKLTNLQSTPVLVHI